MSYKIHYTTKKSETFAFNRIIKKVIFSKYSFSRFYTWKYTEQSTQKTAYLSVGNDVKKTSSRLWRQSECLFNLIYMSK